MPRRKGRPVRQFKRALCTLVLAACAHSTDSLPQTALPNSGAAAPTASYRKLFAFHGTPAGSEPTGTIVIHGELFGTTMGGGTKSLGTVFTRGLAGKVRILHSFQGGHDGSQPEGGLVELNGVLYGTTAYGGTYGDGTVFAIATGGSEHVVYSFKGGADGATPVLAGLVALNGKLYGTTNAGGDSSCSYQSIAGCGTVFDVTPSGTEHVVYRFKGTPDGACPSGSLLASGGVLYGTTNYGGTYNLGSVFKVTTSGQKTTLYSFKGYPDGVTPFGGLAELNGWFYGTTALGGAFQGAGTVFALNSSGTYKVLHSFKGSPDGALPYATLLPIGTSLYGTTELGGSSGASCVGRGIVGCGTVFSIGASGTLNVIYRFKGHKDGMNPLASLAVSGNGKVYGTTIGGGGFEDNGTIFEVTP